MNKIIKMLRINNRFIVTIIILSLYATLGAQELSIKSFETNTRDIADRSNPRLDNNDVPCALVKVHLASADAIFEGSVIGNVEYKTGEYWVYMPNNKHKFLFSSKLMMTGEELLRTYRSRFQIEFCYLDAK